MGQMEESQGWEGPQSPAELGSSGEDCEHLNVWLDFLPEHGSYSGAWWGRWQRQFRPGQEHLSFCFHLCVRGCVGSAAGGGWRLLSVVERVLCDWLWQLPPPTAHLHPASLNCPHCFQPLDLCNPARTLLLSEELLLYEGRNKAVEVRLTHVASPASSRPLTFLLELYSLRVEKS